MKKIFTLAAMACMAMSVNAQTESWYVNNSDGTLKADYVANTDAKQMSVVSFSTTNVTGTHTSGPNNGYIDGALVDGKLPEKIDNSWGGIKKKDLSKDGSVAPFYYVQGNGNPVADLNKVTFEERNPDDHPGVFSPNFDAAYYLADGSAGLPKNGTYVTLTPKVTGRLKVAVWINKGSRDIYVVKESDAKALALGTEVIASGYINGQNITDETDPNVGYPMFQENIGPKGTEGADAYVVGPGTQPSWVYLTFTAEANETYYIFNKNAQIGFGGFEFTPSGGGTGINDITSDTKANPDAPVYNLAGQRVSKDAKGILIQNGKKFVNNK